MTHAPRLFVSFSSKDEGAIRMLFSALAVQRLEVWDYSREGEKLPLLGNYELADYDYERSGMLFKYYDEFV